MADTLSDDGTVRGRPVVHPRSQVRRHQGCDSRLVRTGVLRGEPRAPAAGRTAAEEPAVVRDQALPFVGHPHQRDHASGRTWPPRPAPTTTHLAPRSPTGRLGAASRPPDHARGRRSARTRRTGRLAVPRRPAAARPTRAACTGPRPAGRRRSSSAAGWTARPVARVPDLLAPGRRSAGGSRPGRGWRPGGAATPRRRAGHDRPPCTSRRPPVAGHPAGCAS